MVIKELINKKKSSRSSSRFYINNVCTTDKQIIADGFNSYFVNIGPTLANKIPETNQSPIDNMGTCNLNSVFIEPVIENEVQSEIWNIAVPVGIQYLQQFLNLLTEQLSSHLHMC